MKNERNTLGVWQYFMLVLSIGALLLLAVQSFLPLDKATSVSIDRIDTLLCGFFFADFLLQVRNSTPRTAYLKWGWLDLLSSIPMLPQFRVARLARVIRILRVLRGARASKQILSTVLSNRARGAFGAVVAASLVLLLFSSIAIVNFEPSIGPHDALWWSFFALITGEYGEFYPVSFEGRVIAALLMTAGVALFGTFTASVASFFLEEFQEDDERRDTLTLQKLDELQRTVDELKQLMKGRSTDGDRTEESG